MKKNWKKLCKTQYKITKIKVPRAQKTMKNLSKIGWKIDTNLNIPWKCFKMLQKSNFEGQVGLSWPNLAPTWANLAPTWRILAPTWPNLPPTWANLGPTWAQVRSKMPPRGRKNDGNLGVKKQLLTRPPPPKTPPRDYFGTILIDFGSHFGRFLEQFWWILGPMLDDFWNNFGWFFIHFWHLSHHMKTPPRDEFGTNFDGFWKPCGRIF